jgi:hypothetical protein
VRILARAWIYVIRRCWQDGTAYDPAKHTALQRLLDQQHAAQTAGGPVTSVIITVPGGLDQHWLDVGPGIAGAAELALTGADVVAGAQAYPGEQEPPPAIS